MVDEYIKKSDLVEKIRTVMYGSSSQCFGTAEYERFLSIINSLNSFTFEKPSCRIGDSAYFLTLIDNEYLVDEVPITEVGINGFFVSGVKDKNSLDDYIPYERVGQDVFYNIEHAEQALQQALKNKTSENWMNIPYIVSDFLKSEKDCYIIFQLPSNSDVLSIRFMSYNYVIQTRKEVNIRNYKPVYLDNLKKHTEGETVDNILEGLFSRFNRDALPQNYYGRTLSVSDVVGLKINGKVSFWYVDSIGFQEISCSLSCHTHK